MKTTHKTSGDSIRHATAMDLLKQLWDIREKKPADEDEAPLDVKTDIYSVPPTSRLIPHRPRPMK